MQNMYVDCEFTAPIMISLFLGNGLLTLASYKDFQQDVYCKGNTLLKRSWDESQTVFLFVCVGCYQDKLHPHERNRKQLESKFSKQPGGGASSAAPAAEEPAADEE